MLDLLLDLADALIAGDDARVTELLAPDVVISMPPLDRSGAFRHHFGVQGVLDAVREWQTSPSAADVRPERFLAEGRHALVVAGLRWPADPVRVPVAWLCSARWGQLCELRCFRYPSEALLRLSALAGEAGA